MENEKLETAKTFLNKNSEELYGLWFQSVSSPEGGDPATHVDLCGVMRFESMKAAFEVWIGKWSQKLVSELCLLYNKYRMDDGAGNTMMIALIADMLTPTNLNIPVNSFAVATILLTDGYLERLCGG